MMAKTEHSKTVARLTAVLLAGFLLVGGVLRVWHLEVSSFWVDEVNTVFAAQSLNETGSPYHPSGFSFYRHPFFNRVVAASYSVLGVSEMSSRLPSAVAGILSILLAWLLARKIFDRYTALFTAFLMAVAPFQVGWSRVTKPYAFLQLAVLAAVYLFWAGFERDLKLGVLIEPKGRDRLAWPLLRKNGIIWPWVLLSLGILFWSAEALHDEAFLVPLGFAAYVGFLAAIFLIGGEGRGRFLNKYMISLILCVLGAAGIVLLFPGFLNQALFFLTYTPPWATDPATAANRMYLVEFLLDKYRFPLVAFFMIGAVQLMTRKHKTGFIPLFVFLTPLFLFSFVFTHRVPTYLFFVYPYFLMIAAWGTVNIIRGELDGIKSETFFPVRRRWFLMPLLILGIYLVSPWLRIGLKIPLARDGATNTAVAFNEWREACHRVKSERQADDVILSSLPQVAWIYDVKSDYGLNWSNLQQAQDKEFTDENGLWKDVYVGVECVRSLNHLEDIVASSPRGWIMVTRYHLTHARVVPEEVRHYLESSGMEEYKTENKTVSIFHWDRLAE